MKPISDAEARLYVGQRFGRLTIQAVEPGAMCRCVCDCGAVMHPLRRHLRSGHTTSCGCTRRGGSSARNRTHGRSYTPEYGRWCGMKKRCVNARAVGYADYGGRGIKVCERWLASFTDFLADIGPRPSPHHSIDRINNDGNYEPGNVRWATRQEQSNNRRSNRLLTVDGVTRTCSQWAAHLGCNTSTITWRVRRGWSAERTVTTPLRPGNYKRLEHGGAK